MSPHPARLLKKHVGAFDYPTLLYGISHDGFTTVYHDPSLGQPGKDLAQALLTAASQVNADCAAWFGIPMQPVNLIIAPLSGGNQGDGGAYHYGCDFTVGGDLYIDAAFNNPTMDIGLYVAELTECFMGAAGKGWNCGGSGGEALSRFLAEAESGGANGALAGYSTAPAWDQAGRPNWLDTDQGTDQDAVSTGCGLVYLSWVRSSVAAPPRHNIIEAIVQVGGTTLAENYKNLTGKDTAWADFSAAVAGITITDDDPFSAPIPQPQPQPQPQPGPTGDTTKTDVILALTALVNASSLPD